MKILISYCSRTNIIFIISLLIAVNSAVAQSFEGKVLSSGNKKVPVKTGAVVHLISTDLIDMTRIESKHLLNDSKFDEPLEDTIDNFPNEILNAKTNKDGEFAFNAIPDGKYFIHVTPAPDDLQHLPGGDASRKSVSADDLQGSKDFVIALSSGQYREDLDFRGSHSCIECHKKQPDWEKTGKHWNRTAHKLGWSVPGNPGSGQDFSRFPTWFRSLENWDEAKKEVVEAKIEEIKSSSAYCDKEGKLKTTVTNHPKNPDGKPTHLEIGDYATGSKISTAGFRIRLACDKRVEIKTVYADLFLWKQGSDGKYFITISNRINPTHENAIVHLPIELIYGGGVHRQRFIVSVPDILQQKYGKRKGHYTILQYNIDGSDERWNIDRRTWRDYKISYWWDTGSDRQPGTGDDFIKAPDVNQNTIEAECAGCHVTGAKRIAEDADWKGQVKIAGITDKAGAFDIDQDGHRDEVNVGCESCHGSGSAHNKAMRLDPDKIKTTNIINPKLLSAERADLICGRCHDRRQAVVNNAKTQAVNKEGEFFAAGERRQKIVTEYSAPNKAGPWNKNKHLWEDEIHSKSPRQQYSEHVKSTHYKNDRILVTCSDCHNSHGESEFPSWVKGDSGNPYSSLCKDCHQEIDSKQHMFDKGHPRLDAKLTSCISCHMVGTSRPGGDSGQYGLFANHPPFNCLEEEKSSAYWEGNLNSHVFDVPTRTNSGVLGKAPVDAMPIPYTNSCGACHNVRSIKPRIPDYGGCDQQPKAKLIADPFWQFDL